MLTLRVESMTPTLMSELFCEYWISLLVNQTHGGLIRGDDLVGCGINLLNQWIEGNLDIAFNLPRPQDLFAIARQLLLHTHI